MKNNAFRCKTITRILKLIALIILHFTKIMRVAHCELCSARRSMFRRDHIFPVHTCYSECFPLFCKPRIIGYWSLDGSRRIHWDSSELRYYRPFEEPYVEYDLKEHSVLFERKEDCLDDEKCEHILRWIEKNYEKILDNSKNDKWIRPDFIAYRRIFGRILKSPYKPRIGWIICAVKWKGTIYLCQFDTEEEKHQRMNLSEEFEEKWAWVGRFRQYMLTESPGGEPDLSKAMNQSEEFDCVYQSRLNNHHLLYAAEMRGLCSEEKFEDPLPLDKLKFMELKSRNLYSNLWQENGFKKSKSLDWWAQAYLTGIDDIICGFIDPNEGVVRRLEKKRVSTLQANSKEFWNSAICMNFGDKFLNFVKDIVKKDYDKTIYKFERKPSGNIVATELEPTSEYAFLPDCGRISLIDSIERERRHSLLRNQHHSEMSFSHNESFLVHKNYSTKFPIFDEPKNIGYWSVDGSRKIHWDSSQLRYYTPFKQADVQYDLEKDASMFERKSDCLDDEKCEHILRWIERNYEEILDNSENDKWLKPDFILYRSMLAEIIKSPYTSSSRWIICAAKLKGTIYLCQFDTEEEKNQKKNLTQKLEEIWAWAGVFRQYMLTETPGGEPDTSRAINENEEFCCVYQSRLNNHRLLYAAGMRGLCSDEKLEDPLPLDKLKFMDLTIHYLFPTSKQEHAFKKYKSLRLWAPAYLTGTEKIICGFRNSNEGVVRRLEKIRVGDLEENPEEFWDSAICMNFGDEFLSFIKHTVQDEYDQTIYKFEREPYGDRVTVTELEPTSEYAFLPDWYIRLSEKPKHIEKNEDDQTNWKCETELYGDIRTVTGVEVQHTLMPDWCIPLLKIQRYFFIIVRRISIVCRSLRTYIT